MTTSAERFGDDFGAERMWGLKELTSPEPVSWLPQTPGWWVLGACLLLLLGWVFWLLQRRRQRNAYRREALARLAAIAAGNLSPAELPFVIRKAALLAFPRIDVASLRGTEWREWLNKAARTEVFAAEDSQLLDQLAYQPPEQLAAVRDSAALAQLVAHAQRWMQVHRA